ncbi:MAG: hypothetical protein LBJ60_04255, partial [Tannerellaceae bacterium]|nr:hypothetical protein [Tannerellaceae bacterium]
DFFPATPRRLSPKSKTSAQLRADFRQNRKPPRNFFPAFGFLLLWLSSREAREGLERIARNEPQASEDLQQKARLPARGRAQIKWRREN